jgi:hypothetical protein
MAYENIKADTPGFCCDGDYFYIMKGAPTNMLIQKTSYGDPVMTYPFSHEISLTTKGNYFLSLQFDGVNFWSLEQGDSPNQTTQRILRRWRIENFMCVLKNSWLLRGPAGEKMNGKAFAIESYTGILEHACGPGTGTYPGTDWSYEEMVAFPDEFSVNNYDPQPRGCFFQVSDSFFIVSDTQGIIEEIQVGAIHDYYRIGTASKIQNNFYPGDRVVLRRDLYVFNNASSQGDSGASLYWYRVPWGDAVDPTVLVDLIEQYRGCHESGIYEQTQAATFIRSEGLVGINNGQYVGLIAYIRGQQMLFKRPNLGGTMNYPGPDVYGNSPSPAPDYYFNYVGRNQEFKENMASMIMDTAIKNDRITLHTIYDLAQSGDNITGVTANIYRLQTTYTYGAGALEDSFSLGPYNYVVSIMKPMVTSIGLIAEPALVVANGVDESLIWATVRDQYGAQLEGKRVVFGLTAGTAAIRGYFKCPDSISECIEGSFNWLDGTPHASAEIITGSQDNVSPGQAVIEWRAGTQAGLITIVAIVQP